MPENSNGRGNPVTKRVEYSPTIPNYVAETFAAQQRQKQVQNSLQGTQDALDGVNASVEDFQQRRRNLGIYTEEEKEAARLAAEEEAKKARLAAIERTQEELSDLDGNSEDAEDIYRSFASPEDIRTMEIAKGVGTTVATLPFTAGTIGGVPALTTTATGAVGGYVGAYGGQKLGQYLDGKYGGNTTPGLTTIGGIGGGILGGGLGYKGTVNLGSHGLLPKGGQIMYGKQFVTDVASNALNRNVMQINPALTYGTVKYYGPTMGKTTAAKINPNLVDFDDYVRGDLDALASQLGMTRQQLMMSQDPTVRENARQLMLKSIEGGRQNPNSYGKTLVISKSDVLQDPIFDNQPLVLQRPEFLKRNAARGETNLQNSMDGYASTRRKGGNKLMEWPDPEGVYISELEPFTPDPHRITFTPTPLSGGRYTFYERPSTYFKDATYAGAPETYAGKVVPAWQLPRGQRNQALNGVPESAFVPKSTPLDEVRAAISPSAAQTKFVDDVTRGALITRTTRPKTIDPSALIDFTDEVEDIIAMGKMPDGPSHSYFKLKGLPGRTFLGEGYENAVFTNTGDDVLKFSLGRDIERISSTADRFNVRDLAYTSLEDMIAGASTRLADANKYGFAEPTSLVGYYNNIGPRGQLLYYPVYSQTAMAKGLPNISVANHMSPGVMQLPFGGGIRFKNGQPEITHGVLSRAQGRARAALIKDHPQFDYMSDGLYRNNIFLENDLPIPNDNHSGNFMYGKDGIIRGTDLLKDGGTL